MTTIFSLEELDDNPANGVSNANRAIFGRMDPAEHTFFVFCHGNSPERGAIKAIDGRYDSWFGKLRFLWRAKPDYLLGIGHIKELPSLFLRPRRTKYVIAWHTVLFKKGEAWDVRMPWFLRKIIFNRAAFVVTVSEFAAKSIRRYFPKKKVYGILNGTDVQMFNPQNESKGYLAKKYGIDFSRPIVAFVGALQARKRPDVFAALASLHPEANFVMVGRLAEPWPFLEEGKGPKNLQWIPTMPPKEDVGRFLASSDLFVFPSVNEAAAGVIAEAVASGCVPIVSRSGGSPEFFEEGKSGFSVPVGPGEIPEFSEKIGGLLRDRGALGLLSHAARRKAESYSWDDVACQYREIFQAE